MINTDSCENNYNRVDTHGFVYRKNIGNICDIVCAFTFKLKDNFESCQNGLMLTCRTLKMFLEKKRKMY